MEINQPKRSWWCIGDHAIEYSLAIDASMQVKHWHDSGFLSLHSPRIGVDRPGPGPGFVYPCRVIVISTF